jgi:hypothetical protein
VGGSDTVKVARVEDGATGEVEDEVVARSEARDEAAASFKVRDKAVVSSKAGDEAAACFEDGIEDNRRRRRGGVWGDRRLRALGSFKKLPSVARESTGTEILGHGHLIRDVPVLHASPFS